ncbi:MAG: hypothetical protein Q7J23_04100 [Nitrosomonas sp.]|nr:hypothetical protein [Nitrosomonas sp.]
MTEQLTSKKKWFIRRMRESDEHAKWGFELLLKRQNFAEFFDYLNEAGFFKPECNPTPVPANEPGYVQIPYWPALDYLQACARKANEHKDAKLARKIMTVVGAVSHAREPDGSIRDNYHTYRVFAEILGLLPTSVITLEDLDLIPGWLQSKFDRGMVGHALDTGALKNFLASALPDDWNKACLILRYCTAIRWIDEPELGEKRRKPVTIVDDYWLKKLIEHHASKLGSKIGSVASEIFLERIREVFQENEQDLTSSLWRPAIEDHPQNHSWKGPENRFVEGLRDVLLSWVDHDIVNARPCIEALLQNDAEIVRRIAIFVLGQRWALLRDLYGNALCPQLFDAGHVHELYHLLRTHFNEFTELEKADTIKSIRQLARPSRGEDPDRLLKRIQRDWLSALAGKGYQPAESWFGELMSDQALGALSDHPDFHSYMESWSGPGPTPYQVQELFAFAEDGTLVERLNAFQQTDLWRGPTTRALVDTLVEAVSTNPGMFQCTLSTFLHAKRAYQYGVINGFKHAWEAAPEKCPAIDWDHTWISLVHFFEKLIGTPAFWTEKAIEDRDLTPNRDWIPPVIAEFLRAGTRSDDRAYSPDLLPRTWSLIGILLEHSEAVDEPRDDAMTQAINSPKGKAIEAFFSHALRACRLSDRASGRHVDAWSQMKPVFDQEIAKCENANYEFSTLAANYIANIDYIDRDWLRGNLKYIFPFDFLNNFHCALEGLAYAPATRSIYALLAESGILDFGLRQEPKGRHARKKIVERIALAFLWEDEELDSPRFSYLFKAGRIDDLEQATTFLWSASNQDLSNSQVERILSFWAHCLAWTLQAAKPPEELLSKLGRLSRYIKTVGEREQPWLLAVAPYVHIDYDADYFIEELERLVDISPENVSTVLGKLLETFVPTFDYEDKLKSLLRKLAAQGKREDAIAYTDRLRQLPEMELLFAELTAST